MSGEIDARQFYLQALDSRERELPGTQAWIRELRAHARACFEGAGFPTTREEAWKYTNLAALQRQRFQPVPSASAVTESSLQSAPLDALNAFRLVFVNGYYRADLSTPPRIGNRVVGGSLAERLRADAHVLEAHLGRIAPLDTHPLAALNTAFLLDGAYVELPADAVLERPIHLIYVATADALAQPHALIVAQVGSRATIIEQYVDADGSRYFTNAVTEIVVERGAAVEHYRLQQESAQGFHVGGMYVRQQEGSQFTAHAIDLGGLLVRNDVRTQFAAENASCTLNGLYIADGRQHVDNHTLIDHAKPRGTSREFYKGVLGGRARAIFNGRVIVHPDAQQTDAEQVNNNLLLSEDAEIDTKPELEIYADDVKCSHGATVGQLDEDQLFYLRARGIDDAQARDLLTFAFANDVLHRFRLAPLRGMLERALNARLLQGRGLKELELI